MTAPADEELLRLMDLNMQAMYRHDTVATPGGEVVEAAGLVLCRTPRGHLVSNMTMVTAPVDVATVRALTASFYRGTGCLFSVWTRAHADAALEAALERDGFHRVVSLPGMALRPGDERPPRLPAGIRIRPVADEDGRAAYADLMAAAYAVYGTPVESTRERFATMASVRGPRTQAFLAWRDGRPVAGAISWVAHGVGAVNWVGTHPDEFGKGYGAAVTWAVVEEGRRRGARFVTLQASVMGAPVYRRMGFATPTAYNLFATLD
jgi:GNAT superfamily N-acetyltransferase